MIARFRLGFGAYARAFQTDVYTRRRRLFEAVGVSLAPWLILTILLLIKHPATWPWNRPDLLVAGYRIPLGVSKFDVALIIWVTELLLIKSYLMWARTQALTWLGASMVGVNLAFAVAYYSVTLQTFWPTYQYMTDVRQAVRVMLAVAVTFAIIRLSMSVEPTVQEQRTAWQLIRIMRQEANSLRRQLDAMTAQVAVLTAQNALLASAFDPPPTDASATPR